MTSNARPTWSRKTPDRSSISTMPPSAVVTAKLQAQLAIQQRDSTLNQLLGKPDLPIEDFPAYARRRPRSNRPSATSTIRCCGRRSRHRNPGRCDPTRPLRHRRHAGVQRRRRHRAVGRRQSEGNRRDLAQGRPAGDDRRRHLPGPRFNGAGLPRSPRHRRSVRDPAAAERQRQLGEGGAAPAGADGFDTGRGHHASCAPA